MTSFRLCEISHGSFEPLQCFPTRQAGDCQPSLLLLSTHFSQAGMELLRLPDSADQATAATLFQSIRTEPYATI